jgi:spore germination protein KA
MFQKIIKYIKFKNHLKSEEKSSVKKERYVGLQYAISKNLQYNFNNIKNIFGNSADIRFRKFRIGNKEKTKAFICFVDGLEDEALLDEYITKALMMNIYAIDDTSNLSCKDFLTVIKENLSSASEVKEVNSMDKIVDAILSGSVALYIDGYDRVLTFGAINIKLRSVEEPSTEALVRGPREGFVESIRTNTTLLRRKIKNPNLVFEALKLGEQTQTNVIIAYINGIANESIINEVRRRLNEINTDSILESGYIEQFIEDHPFSPFPTIGNSERPDRVAAKLLEGRVAILCDGTPFVLTVPNLFIENIQSSEDYYSRPLLMSVLRLLRVVALNATILTPALYIALTTFHPEMIPTVLLITTAASREGVPFPALVETLIMITIFEILRESGIRLPRQLGQALSIVGVLVIGEAAVRAGIIGSTMIIIGAFTGITSFIILPLLDVIIIYRFLLIILSGLFGFYGIILGLIAMLAHTCSLKSFGVPYMAPIAPTIWQDLKDSFLRFPLWLMHLRPKSLTPRNLKRQNSFISDFLDKKDGGEDA